VTLCTWLAGGLRAVIRGLMTQRTSVGAIEKAVRGGLLVPVFATLLLILRARAMLLGPLRIEATTPDGSRFACHLPDLIQMYIYLFGVWEPDIAALLRGRLREGDVFVDVGANVGFDAVLASRCVGERGRVVAIEASPPVFQRLEETLRLNAQPGNVRLLNMAAGAQRGTLEVYSGPAHNVGLTTTVARPGMRRVASVDAAPLGDLLLEDEVSRVRIVKIDVEGGETAVLAGFIHAIDRLPRDVLIAVELSPMWWRDRSPSAADVLQPFIQRGFNVYTIANNYWPWRYLWPNEVRPPARMHDLSVLSQPVKRLDVVLSRADAATLTDDAISGR
jgi:FkbM family methyltransferase